MKEEEHRLYGRPCLLVQLYADGSVCFQAFTEMKKSEFAEEENGEYWEAYENNNRNAMDDFGFI